MILAELKEDDYVATVKREKKRGRLHAIAEERLKAYLNELFPNDHVALEVAGIPGGRNDAVKFSYNQHIAVFEFFFSPSQVSQDLRLLEQYKSADVQVAILLDRDVDPKLAETYFHKKPDSPFPIIWLRDLLVTANKEKCLRWLSIYTKLTDESQLSLFLQMPNLSNFPDIQADDSDALIFALRNIAGKQAIGTYAFAGQTLEEVVSKIMEKAIDMSKLTPVSFSISEPKRSRTGDMQGDITVQF